MNTQEKFVITISRELGSGGHTIGKKLADRLGVRFCDKELIKELSKRFNLTPSSIERLKSEKKNWLSDFITKLYPMPSAGMLGVDSKFTQEFREDVTTDDIFKAEVEILKGFAEMGSCVIAGRLGFFVFKDHPNKLNVFITAPAQYRIERIMNKQGLSEEKASKLIDSIDRSRENYIKRYAGVSRYDARNYDLVMNAEGHSEEELADLILSYIGQA